MNTQSTYRYPGVKPFSENEKSFFFGRDEDVQNLYRFLDLEQLIVLYSKSGYGKSSLLNAGLIPEIEFNNRYLPLSIRFGTWVEDDKMTLSEILIAKIMNETKSLIHEDEVSFLNKFEHSDNSIWFYIKKVLVCLGTKGVIFIFDQFEEIFTYPEEQILEFKKKMAELLYSEVPNIFRKQLRDNSKNFTRSEKNTIYQKNDLKCVFSIRADRMSLLDKLRDYLPEILQNNYELTALHAHEAEDAIIIPAILTPKGINFRSPVFEYHEAAIKKIINYLTKDGKQRVESFQLQVVSQYIESRMIEEPDVFYENNKFIVRDTHLPDLKNVFQSYYDSLIDRIPKKEDRKAAQVFIEEGLILDEKRVSLPELVIYNKYAISKQLLRQLVDTHLLRAEPNTVGGQSYELSHDTLVAPILKSKERHEILKVQAEQKRKNKRLLYLLSLAALFVVGLLFLVLWVYNLKMDADSQKEQAIAERDKVEHLQSELEQKNEKVQQLMDQMGILFGTIKDDQGKFVADVKLTNGKFTEKSNEHGAFMIRVSSKMRQDTFEIIVTKENYIDFSYTVIPEFFKENKELNLLLKTKIEVINQGLINEAEKLVNSKKFNTAESKLKKAIENGSVTAQLNLGELYERENKIVEAKQAYAAAAAKGNIEANFKLGELFIEQRDYPSAKDWHTRGAESGYVGSMFSLGQMYRKGQLLKDLEKAKDWYLKAANKGHAYSQVRLGNIYYFDEHDYKEAYDWYKKAADGGNVLAFYNLGFMYEKGKGVKKSKEKARLNYQKSIDGGNQSLNCKQALARVK